MSIYRSYETPKDAISLYFQNKLKEEEEIETEYEQPRPKMYQTRGLQGQNVLSQKAGGSNLRNGSPLNGKFINVYGQQQPQPYAPLFPNSQKINSSGDRSLERKDKDLREVRAKNISDKLSIVKGGVQSVYSKASEENRSPNRVNRQSPPLSVRQQYSEKSPGATKKPTANPVKRDSGFSTPTHMDYAPLGGYPNTTSDKNSHFVRQSSARGTPSPSPPRPPTGKSTTKPARVLQPAEQYNGSSRGSYYEEKSDSRSQSSSSSRSKGGLSSLPRNDSLERRLEGYVRNRRVASKTAVRLNINILSALDGILWRLISANNYEIDTRLVQVTFSEYLDIARQLHCIYKLFQDKTEKEQRKVVYRTRLLEEFLLCAHFKSLLREKLSFVGTFKQLIPYIYKNFIIVLDMIIEKSSNTFSTNAGFERLKALVSKRKSYFDVSSTFSVEKRVAGLIENLKIVEAFVLEL